MSEMPPPPPMPAPPMGEKPQDYQVLAIVATVLGAITCTCIPLITGIIGIVYSNKSRQAYAAGDMGGAVAAANTAKILVIISFVVLAVGVLFNIIAVSSGWYNFNFSTG